MPPGGQPDHPARVLRVLLVEDEIMIALLLEEMIADLGHEVVGPAARLDRAVELAQSEAVDLALLDVNLDGNQVYPVAETLAARGIPFAFVTGYGRLGLLPPYGDRPTLQKPFRRNALSQLVETLRGGKGA